MTYTIVEGVSQFGGVGVEKRNGIGPKKRCLNGQHEQEVWLPGGNMSLKGGELWFYNRLILLERLSGLFVHLKKEHLP